MGGALSLASASLCEGINASCPFYGYNGKLGLNLVIMNQ